MKNQQGFLQFHMVAGLIALLGAGGWIANIVKLVSVDVPLAEFGTMEILRIVGIFLAPLGSILGFI